MGSQQVALLEAKNINGMMTGFTANYIKVAVDYKEDWVNQLIPIQLVDLAIDTDELMVRSIASPLY